MEVASPLPNTAMLCAIAQKYSIAVLRIVANVVRHNTNRQSHQRTLFDVLFCVCFCKNSRAQKQCANCGIEFEINDDDVAFLDKVSPVFSGHKELIPPPTLCPDCRTQRRLAIRNERKLYSKESDLSGQSIISLYSPDKSYKVFSQQEWWSDKWDAMEYGIEFDFSRPFFPQFKELADAVPKLPLHNIQEENAAMCNFSGYNKDCYLIFGSDENQSCYYDHWIFECKDTVDSSFCYNSQLLWDCVDCIRCYACKSCQDCEASSHCTSCFDLKGCEYCFGCVGLRQKKYHAINTYNFSGDFIVNSKNVYRSFDVRNAEDIRHSHDIFDNAKDYMDSAFTGNAQMCYEAYEAKGHNILFCNRVWPCSFSLYLDNCDNCTQCFGCCGIRRKQYCILNKQYTKEEYEGLVPKIISHMRSTGEWGEFFPVSDSPFGYNETSAMDYYPLSKEETLEQGFKWTDYEPPIPQVSKIIPAAKLLGNIEDIPDDILNWAIECEATNRPFKIIKQELDFYRKENIPIPKRHPDQRHQDRLARRNPRKLWKRTCDKCGQGIRSSYDPKRPEIVYCEECYLKEVY